ncbi:sensor histidine kinase [Schlesneria paludicola]|uniref:sensor histidine kinase n=1 Tax=Schlesneria paludicola TaxID=360056 RepID=UPI00138B1AE4|nr:HAMP domain-containing protein [Schlesneria paludicola]
MFESNPNVLRGDFVVERRSNDEQYRLLIEIPPPFSRWEILPYFAWILVLIVAMGYGFAVNIVRPLKRLQNAVVQLGSGKLDIRVDFNRRDEFGELGRAFDHMAQRIESLLTAERLLLQDISHELRSPLTRLRFALDLARNNEAAEPAFQRVDREVFRLAELVDQLLQLTRAEGDIASRTTIDISLADLILESIDDFQLEAASKKCSIALISLEPQMLIRGESELIRRAFENVLSNALRHAPFGSKITVNLLRDGRNAAVSIRDHGSGVPEEMITEILCHSGVSIATETVIVAEWD